MMTARQVDVFLMDDNGSIRKLVRLCLEKAGFSAIHEASSFKEALEAVERLSLLQTETLLAILDGNLNEGSVSNEDGLKVAVLLKTKIPRVRIIFFSSAYCQEFNSLSNYYVPKEIGWQDLLLRSCKELLENTLMQE